MSPDAQQEPAVRQCQGDFVSVYTRTFSCAGRPKLRARQMAQKVCKDALKHPYVMPPATLPSWEVPLRISSVGCCWLSSTAASSLLLSSAVCIAEGSARAKGSKAPMWLCT